MTPSPLPWMPAKAFGGPFRPPAATFVVIHCTESDNGAGTAESLAGPNWFGGSKAGTSAHRIFDRNSGVEMVRATTVAYHAGPGGNTWGRAYEFCGRASWTAAQWRAPEQLHMLRLAAPYIAQDLIEITGSRQAAIDACRWLSVVQVAQHAHGLCTHNDIRLAFPGTTTHSDPGPNFPYAELLAYVLAELTGAPAGTEEDDMFGPQHEQMLTDLHAMMDAFKGGREAGLYKPFFIDTSVQGTVSVVRSEGLSGAGDTGRLAAALTAELAPLQAAANPGSPAGSITVEEIEAAAERAVRKVAADAAS